MYVSGYSNGTWGSPVRSYSSGNDGFAAKLNSSGALTWNTFLGGSGWDQGNAVAVDGSGNVYVAGYSSATWGSPVTAFSGTMANALAVKLNNSGSLIWNTFYAGGGNGVPANGIAVDGSGSVYLAGNDNNNGFTLKLDSSGNLSWTQSLGGSGGDTGNAVAVDGSGNVYVSGTSSATWGSPVRAYGAADDAYVAKISSNAYYSKGSLAVNTASNWNTARDGSGSNASSFPAGYTWIIQNGHSMTLTGSSTWDVSSTGIVEIESGGSWTNSSSGAVTIGTLQVDGGGTYSHGTTNALPGTTKTFQATGTVNYSYAGAQTVEALTYGHLTISGSGTKTLAGAITPAGDLTVSAGTLDLSSYTANRATSGGTITVSNGATLKIGGTNGFPSNYATPYARRHQHGGVLRHHADRRRRELWPPHHLRRRHQDPRPVTPRSTAR